MSEADNFDQVAYWRERHQKLRGDHRATGHISRSPAEMRQRKVYQAYYYAAILHLLKKQFFPEGETAISDIGCGTGFLASLVSEVGFSYFGYDISPVAVEDSAAMAPAANFSIHNIVEAPPKPADIVIASEVLFHIVDDAQWHNAIANIKAAMKPNGVFMFTETFVAEIDDNMPKHFRPRTRAMYVEALAKHGLRFMDDGEAITSRIPVFTENSNYRTTMHLVTVL